MYARENDDNYGRPLTRLKIIWKDKSIIVRQVSLIFQPNCAFCEESTTFGTLVEYHIMKRFGYGAISNSASEGCGSHFSKWPTAVTVMMHICFTGEECSLTVKYYLK